MDGGREGGREGDRQKYLQRYLKHSLVNQITMHRGLSGKSDKVDLFIYKELLSFSFSSSSPSDD